MLIPCGTLVFFFFSDLHLFRSQFRASVQIETWGVNPNLAAGIIWLICPCSAHGVAEHSPLWGVVLVISKNTAVTLWATLKNMGKLKKTSGH